MGVCFFGAGSPVAVPDKIFGLTFSLDFIDRCHSLPSLLPPPAAVGSLPEIEPRFDSASLYAKKQAPLWVSAFLVPATGIEPVRMFSPRDFKSLVSTYSTMPACNIW